MTERRAARATKLVRSGSPRRATRIRLPQGPWFPWCDEFRWDRFPWQGSTRREDEARRDQRDLAAFVEAVATTVGAVAREAGFAFRPDATGLDSSNGERTAVVLYEADPADVADRIDVQDGEGCVDLWIHWSPDTRMLDLSLPGRMGSIRPRAVERDALGQALEAIARDLARRLDVRFREPRPDPRTPPASDAGGSSDPV